MHWVRRTSLSLFTPPFRLTQTSPAGLHLRTGGKKGAKPHQCAKCSGAGEITVNRMLAGRMLAQSRAVCPVCEGEGTKIRDKDTCRKCSGQKVVSKKEKARWQVEKGMRDGDRIVLKEHGDEWVRLPLQSRS